MQKIIEEPLTICPACGGRLKKMISNTSFILKGTGWYATDYASDRRKPDSKDSETKSEKKEKSDESRKEPEKAEKTDKKSDAKETAVSK